MILPVLIDWRLELFAWSFIQENHILLYQMRGAIYNSIFSYKTGTSETSLPGIWCRYRRFTQRGNRLIIDFINQVLTYRHTSWWILGHRNPPPNLFPPNTSYESRRPDKRLAWSTESSPANGYEGYWQKLCTVIEAGRITGAQIHDARIAALCKLHGVRKLWTADRDFSRFPELNTQNPLVEGN